MDEDVVDSCGLTSWHPGGWSWIGLARERFSILYIPEHTETPRSPHGTTYTDADQRKK